jgi:outer membrane murein-binding lipoprotein Lpp
MALPRVIQEQIDQADAMVAQMNGQTAPNAETAPEPDPNPDVNPETQTQPISQEEEPKPAPVPEETWERKYLTLKGMYDAEVPRLHSQMRELNQQVQTLIAEAAVAKAQQPKQDAAPAKTLITEQDKEAFGSDLLDLIDRATEQKLAGNRDLEAQLRAEINELKGKLGNVTERQVVSDKDRYEAALSSQVPDWEAMNVDQGFLTWLAEVDPVYGMPRQYALTNAYESLDANRTATLFKQYKATLAPAPRQQANRELQRQVAPTRSHTSPAPTTSTADKRVYTTSDIDSFYAEWRRGMIDEAEAVQIERDIHAAINEGRIR